MFDVSVQVMTIPLLKEALEKPSPAKGKKSPQANQSKYVEEDKTKLCKAKPRHGFLLEPKEEFHETQDHGLLSIEKLWPA